MVPAGLPVRGVAATGGREPITTIAFEWGYESAAAFATMFRRTMAVAPSRYRVISSA